MDQAAESGRWLGGEATGVEGTDLPEAGRDAAGYQTGWVTGLDACHKGWVSALGACRRGLVSVRDAPRKGMLRSHRRNSFLEAADTGSINLHARGPTLHSQEGTGTWYL